MAKAAGDLLRDEVPDVRDGERGAVAGDLVTPVRPVSRLSGDFGFTLKRAG
ncbi:hypothetical protein KIH74_04450 [Kineosporia sp. J2-2]|uniref:Uncharacterized protein n=1 Tax=Kineosporia corallincola TaxID=2835133 RepID=A0ABS5TEX6_9ACTN|nr:hypothetical protein [Kineosporia corallincola]MBT0768159.1 hypothetical protein [Kineosporia corallincola]